MRIRLISVMIGISALLFLFVSGCAQQNGNNTQPAGTETAVTEGTQAPVCVHNWQDATCTTAKTCTICGATEGSLAAHDYSAWVPNGEGMHIRICKWDETHREQAPCFNGNTPIEGDVCADCGYIYDPSHVHVYDQQIDTPNYKASGATCSVQAGYYYSCSCGMAGTDIFHSGELAAHTEVIDEGKHATFSVPGLSDGTHCSVCGSVVKPQIEIPALGSDLAVGTDYMDKEGNITYRYSYSFTFYENDRFNMTTLKVGSDESYELNGENGSLKFLDNGVYELVFDSGREAMYITIKNGKVELCEKDGGPLKGGHDKRPTGQTQINITPRPGNSVYGYLDLARNSHGDSMQELYYRLYAACEAFMDSGQDVDQRNGNYSIDKVNLDYYILTGDEAVAVWKIFLIENPRYYWLSNTLEISKGQLEICIDPEYASAEYRRQCDEAISVLEQACADALAGKKNELEKAMTVHDFILGKLNYAYEADGATPQDDIWAHNLIGIAEKGLGVCESYAKAYQYLCRINGLDCMVVTGFNRENHAWNLVRIDGKWYGVDCTFDETNKDEVSYACFGMYAARMREEYQADSPNNRGIGYLYALPTVSDRNIELVDLSKNGTYIGVYESIDAAFQAMTDANAEYEISLHLYESRGALLLSSAVIEHHIYSKSTPKVRHLTITQKNDDLVGGFYHLHRVFLQDGLKLNSDLAIYNLDINGSGILDLQSNTLSCFGKIIYISVPVEGSMQPDAPSVVEMGEIEHYVTFWSTVRVHTLRQIAENPSGFSFSADTHVAELYAYDFGVYDTVSEGIHATIDHFHALKTEKWSPLPRMSVSGAANVHVGRITSEGAPVYLYLKFGKLEEFGNLTIGSAEAEIILRIKNKIAYFSTDVNGNIVAEYVHTADINQLTKPLVTLENPSVMNHMTITLLDNLDYDTYQDVTAEYMLNENNQIVRKS